MYNSVAVIGGDKRQLYCAKAFVDDGFMVSVGGFDKLKSEGGLKMTSPFEAALKSEIIVLPLPCVKGGKLNAPFSKDDIYFDEALLSAVAERRIFCGMKQRLLEIAPTLKKELIYDYSQREEFQVKNAVSTAEGALEIAMREFEGTISNSRVLVCGYGRIGKVLAEMLSNLNADVTVSARKKSDLAWINLRRCTAVKFNNLVEEVPFNIIFNTVPSLVLDSYLLSHIAKKAVVIDLSSIPGGVDFEACRRMDICAIHALSLPGRCSPKTAGETIKDTITNMIEED